MTGPTSWTVVVPTIGRPELARMLASLAAACAVPGLEGPQCVFVVDDRPADAAAPLQVDDAWLPVRTVRSGGRGPAAARNVGWRLSRTAWVVFLDDDVVLSPDWATTLHTDLESADDGTAAVYGRLQVPRGRRPTDWERNTAGLETARYATADAAVRRTALLEVEGFDERFGRAYREDADIALRLRQRGWALVDGRRQVVHPVRAASPSVSVRTQEGARDDARMRVLHGRRWRADAQTGSGRFPLHVATVCSGALALVGAVARVPAASVVGGAVWAALTLDFLTRRVAAGPLPGDPGWAEEWARMAWTSVLIPPAAVTHRVVGEVQARRDPRPWRPPARAVLFDRDGTLVHDVPYNGDPGQVRPVPGARAALDTLRRCGIGVGLVTNQSGVARGLIDPGQVEAVNARVAELLGPFDVVAVCPHGPDDGCSCRKPEPGLVLDAARRLRLAPWECAVLGDTGADVEAGIAAGARVVLVPTGVTLSAEVDAAPATAGDLAGALRWLSTKGRS